MSRRADTAAPSPVAATRAAGGGPRHSHPAGEAHARTLGPSDHRTLELSYATWRPTFGAIADPDGTTFRVWASGPQSVTLVIDGQGDRPERRVALQRTGEAGGGRTSGRGGLFEARVDHVGAGSLYRYVLDGRGPFPDPASRFQPDGVHGPSEVIGWTSYAWSDEGWRGVRFEDLVLYELHVGTFTDPGSFLGVIDRLPYLVDLGVTAIELMPVAAFAGRRNWGYDGVALFAPACQYGRPRDLQHLVDRAHAAGLAVVLDVVYNHLGPDGAYLPAFSPDFFSPHHQSPWGDGVNLDGPGSDMVRAFLVENALHWILEYHVDGLRLDATHALVDESDEHVLEELAAAAHGLALGRPIHVIAEDARNLGALVRRTSRGGMGLDGVWADDFHHEMHRRLTGERGGYYADYSGSAEDLATTLNRGWFYTGQHSEYEGRARGSDAADVDRQRFVFCLQNHDQVGNRALGERLDALTDLASCRAAAAVLLLAPETPLLFMGEEWAASTPFQYFTDHHDELGRLVTEGRRREFAKFEAFSDPDARIRIPDPQDERTFAASRLKWDEPAREPHASTLRLYRALLALRGQDPPFAEDGRGSGTVAHALDADTIAIRRRTDAVDLLLIARFSAGGTVSVPWSFVGRDFSPAAARDFSPAAIALTTEDAPFAPDAEPPHVSLTGSTLAIDFARPGAVVFRLAAT